MQAIQVTNDLLEIAIFVFPVFVTNLRFEAPSVPGWRGAEFQKLRTGGLVFGAYARASVLSHAITYTSIICSWLLFARATGLMG